jgi:outer membrane receptor protein involved in Fe transport
MNDEFPLSGGLTGFVGASASYVGDRLDNFAPPPRQDLPAYTKIDARAGLKWDSWSASLFVTNATDKRGLLGGGAGNFIPYAYQYIQPRTVGLSVAKTF